MLFAAKGVFGVEEQARLVVFVLSGGGKFAVGIVDSLFVYKAIFLVAVDCLFEKNIFLLIIVVVVLSDLFRFAKVRSFMAAFVGGDVALGDVVEVMFVLF